MERYIGLDVHAESCTLAVVGPTGKRLKVEVVGTNGAELKQAMRAIPGTKRLCLEEGTQSAWLYELMRSEADEVVVTMPAKRSGPKDAYCGLAIVMRSSADWARDRTGKWVRASTQQSLGLNRNRCGLLKEVFKGAAHLVATLMTTHPLHADYQRLLEAGVKPNLAMVTIARRIAAAVLAMWKHEEAYDSEKHRSQVNAQA